MNPDATWTTPPSNVRIYLNQWRVRNRSTTPALKRGGEPRRGVSAPAMPIVPTTTASGPDETLSATGREVHPHNYAVTGNRMVARKTTERCFPVTHQTDLRLACFEATPALRQAIANSPKKFVELCAATNLATGQMTAIWQGRPFSKRLRFRVVQLGALLGLTPAQSVREARRG